MFVAAYGPGPSECQTVTLNVNQGLVIPLRAKCRGFQASRTINCMEVYASYITHVGEK